MTPLPCPFCGHHVIHLYGPTCRPHDIYDPADRLFPVARCGGCYAEVPGQNDDFSPDCKTALAAWNRRAPR